MVFQEGILLHLDKQACCASYSAAGTLRVWRAAQADQAMIPHREGRTRGSRMLCADELWRLGGHDPYSLIMIRRFGRDPSGSYSVAGCGKCQKLGEYVSRSGPASRRPLLSFELFLGGDE